MGEMLVCLLYALILDMRRQSEGLRDWIVLHKREEKEKVCKRNKENPFYDKVRSIDRIV